MGFKTVQIHETKTLTASQATTLQVPSSGIIHNLILRFAETDGTASTLANILTSISNIRLTFNGRDIVNTSPDKLRNLYQQGGVFVENNAGVDGNIELNIGRLMFNDQAVRDVFGYGTADVTSIQVTVTASGTLTDVASVQAITAREAGNKKLGAHIRFIDYPQSFNATGQHTVDTLPRDPQSAYMSVLVSNGTGAAGVMSNGEVRANNVTLVENLRSDTNTLLMSNNRMEQNLTNNAFVYGFGDGSSSTVIPMVGVTDFRFINTFTTAPGANGYIMSALTVNGLSLNK